MAEAQDNQAPTSPGAPAFVGVSPHLLDAGFTTRRMMIDVLIGLVPLAVAAGLIFGPVALVRQVVICCAFGLATEAIFAAARRKPFSLTDGSALVTCVILAFSIPPALPWYAGAIGAIVAIGLGKMVFGGLGFNIFNPAMVGRAFLMAAFPALMASSAFTYAAPDRQGPQRLDAISQASPLSFAKLYEPGEGADTARKNRLHAELTGGRLVLGDLFLGTVRGSLGETSALAALVGGLWLLLRGTASWRIPVGVLGVLLACTAIGHAISPETVMHPLSHLFGGAVMFGAFFIATDPVSSPLTKTGRWVFGGLIGGLVFLIRQFSVYPEGVMYAVLLANAAMPLINRATVPTPLGGDVAKMKK